MKNFYFRSKILVTALVTLLVLTGCTMYPAITPVENNQQINVDADLVAKNDVEENKVIHLELDDFNSKPTGVEQGVTEGLQVDFEAQPIVDLEIIETVEEQQAETDDTTEQQQSPVIDEVVLKEIALTFDDGPDAKYTPQVLDILQEKGVKATFFIVGIQIKKYPEIVQRMVNEGHLIANHTYTHPNLVKLSEAEILQELDSTDVLIEETVGFKPDIVRPPYGAINDKVRNTIEETGRHIVLWNIDPRDWASTPIDEMYANVMQNARDEGNILFHSFGGKQIQNTVDLLPQIIDSLLAEGYTFVTADTFIEEKQQ